MFDESYRRSLYFSLAALFRDVVELVAVTLRIEWATQGREIFLDFAVARSDTTSSPEIVPY